MMAEGMNHGEGMALLADLKQRLPFDFSNSMAGAVEADICQIYDEAVRQWHRKGTAEGTFLDAQWTLKRIFLMSADRKPMGWLTMIRCELGTGEVLISHYPAPDPVTRKVWHFDLLATDQETVANFLLYLPGLAEASHKPN